MCANEVSTDWMERIVPTIKPEGVCLKTTVGDELPKPHVCIIFVPNKGGKRLNPKRILSRLRTDLWTVWGSTLVENRQVWRSKSLE